MVSVKRSHNQLLNSEGNTGRLSVNNLKSTRKEKLGSELSASKEVSIAF